MSDEATTQPQTEAPAPEPQSAPAEAAKPAAEYVWGTGRRKTAVARVRIRSGS